MKQNSLIETLQELGFTQYEAQCYLGLLREHPLNGSQLSAICGVPRSMVYQTLGRLEEKAAIVRLSSQEGEPQQYEQVAPGLLVSRLSARFQVACKTAERQLTALMQAPPAEVMLNIVGTNDILRQAALLIRRAQQRIALMGNSSELATLERDLQAASARGITTRIVSVGAAPAVEGQIASYPGENVSAPAHFLLVIADSAPVLMAAFPPDTRATAVLTENPILARLLSAFLNTEYYIIRASNRNPALMGQVLAEILEPEDRERYAHVLRFFERKNL